MRRITLLAITSTLIAASTLVLTSLQPAQAHCEVPCGIYDDHARVAAMLEDAETIAKAVTQIQALSDNTDAQSLNQATRWVMTKEDHATRIQHTISQYFLTQRVKAAAPDTPEWRVYQTKLTRHHAVLVAAMKTKQTVDPKNVVILRKTISQIAGYYPRVEIKKDGDHGHSHGDHGHSHGDGDHDHK